MCLLNDEVVIVGAMDAIHLVIENSPQKIPFVTSTYPLTTFLRRV